MPFKNMFDHPLNLNMSILKKKNTCFTRERTKPRLSAGLRCSLLIVIPQSSYHYCIGLMKTGYQKRCWIEEYILVTSIVSLRQCCKDMNILSLCEARISRNHQSLKRYEDICHTGARGGGAYREVVEQCWTT